MKLLEPSRVMFATEGSILMSPSSISTIPQARAAIFSQEDISLGIKQTAYKLFLHELETPRKGRPVSVKAALDHVLGWMRIQKAKEERANLSLNPIQKKILYLLVVEGYTQNQAALELNRSRDTVKKYCMGLRKQLGVDSFLQVVAIAVERGWIPSPSTKR